jgi:hypothetical protein
LNNSVVYPEDYDRGFQAGLNRLVFDIAQTRGWQDGWRDSVPWVLPRVPQEDEDKLMW